MADVLLAHSNHLPYDRKQVRKMEPYPPLATLYAAGLLRQHGVSVAVFDATFQEPEAGFRSALRIHKPKIVAIFEDDFNFLTKMCLTRMRELAFHMIDTARSCGAHVIVHGSDATDHAADFLRRGADCVLEGEAEYSLLQVVEAVLCGSPFADIPGVKHLRRLGAREIVESCHHQRSREVPALPLPARDLIDLTPYRRAWKQARGFFSMNLISSRGCPFRCNWCAKPIFGDSYQVRPAADVAREMQILQEQYGADRLWFADDIFGLNRHWLSDLALAVEQLRCALPFKVQARADLITADSARDLKRAGCAEVWMGVESGSQKVLDAMDKGLQVEEIIAARQHLKRQGIRSCYFLQFGYPGEHWVDIQRTIALVRETRPDDIGVSFSYPLPNTRFYARVKQQLGAKQNWADSDDLCVMFKGAYTDNFYRAIRDALHAEVESWHSRVVRPNSQQEITELWRRVDALESTSRNLDATEIAAASREPHTSLLTSDPFFVPLQAVAAPPGDAND
jgi:radical SAM superfamily enzyme YgiQ (UPF0313 family)